MNEKIEWVLVPKKATQEMCAAAVIFANGASVYETVAEDALKIEESIYGESYAAMIAAAPNPPSFASQWIPVSERLPLEDDGTVAVLLDDGEVITGWGKYSHNRFSKWGFPCDVYNDCVTHWCKLPPLQKNEGADK